MYSYFIRRFLLIIPTFIGITFLCFTVTRFVPGGPVEQAVLRFQQAAAQHGEGGAGSSTSTDRQGQISEEMMQRLKEIYGFDKPFYIAYVHWLWRVLHLDLGVSDTYSRPVWDLIKEKFPISIWFGLTGFVLSYSICIPLGVWKAVKHGSTFDTASSFMVFVAYSVPGWTAGVILLMLLGGGSYWDVFPLGGIQSTAITSESYLAGYLLEGSKAINLPAEVRKEYPDLKDEEIINSNHPAFAKIPADKREKLQKGSHSDLSSFGRFLDKARHMVLPVFCYVLGMFASMTVLMKNSLMENLGQDYVRTAFAKGLSEKTVIFKHALRNSLIPIATGLGHMLSLILAGSYLIEKVFNIKGFGLLGYESLIARDYPVTLGILVIGSLLKLFGNIFSDILYCVIDPRIRFS
ncbi:MAG: microcin transport system permease protein [Clostridiales bacterium]|jgi:microcin C transport system permease protein|nr:microcin transport system permease protein [Clostridiales bacterium]MDN5282204.1 microcin transport system permease protein [Candidatus Ozemobacter sp.]